MHGTNKLMTANIVFQLFREILCVDSLTNNLKLCIFVWVSEVCWSRTQIYKIHNATQRISSSVFTGPHEKRTSRKSRGTYDGIWCTWHIHTRSCLPVKNSPRERSLKPNEKTKPTFPFYEQWEHCNASPPEETNALLLRAKGNRFEAKEQIFSSTFLPSQSIASSSSWIMIRVVACWCPFQLCS